VPASKSNSFIATSNKQPIKPSRIGVIEYEPVQFGIGDIPGNDECADFL
jgi:hypothetical protein